MDKILINVYVPIINESYDMMISPVIKTSELLTLVKKAVSELSDGRFIANTNNVLCLRNDGTIININLSAFESGIENGSKLMLI